MKRPHVGAALVSALLLACATARASWLFGAISAGKIRPVQRLSDQRKYAEVLAALTPQFIQTLRGKDLRQAYVLMGDSHVALGRPTEALGDYQLGVSLFPNDVDLSTRLATLLHKNGLDKQARPLFLSAIKSEPRHWSAHLGLAEIDHRLGFLDRSADHYEVVLEALDKNAGVWRDYAEVLLALHEIPTAELALQKALTLEPNSPEAHVSLAFVRRERGDLDAAIAEIDSALALGAGVGARRAKALLYLEKSQFDRARAAADEVLRTDPVDGAALWVRARARLAASDVAGAERDLALVQSIDGRNVFAARAARALLDRIRQRKASAAQEETGS